MFAWEREGLGTRLDENVQLIMVQGIASKVRCFFGEAHWTNVSQAKQSSTEKVTIAPFTLTLLDWAKHSSLFSTY